jgi:type II secretory pathway pseudopilin PulG
MSGRVEKQLGITLLEALLALAIMGMITTLVIRQFQSFRSQQDIMQARFNVDKVFQAAGAYYNANCNVNRDYSTGAVLPTGLPGTATLDPTTGAITSPYVLANITTLLGTPGYFSGWPWPPKAVPIIDSTASNSGYAVQFNVGAITNKVRDGLTLSRSYFWKVQVAIKLRAGLSSATYRAALNADCASTMVGSTVTPCNPTTPPPDGGWLVWERLPSLAVPSARTSLWVSTPQLQQFKEQYTHDAFYEANYPGGQFADNYYYLCGG